MSDQQEKWWETRLRNPDMGTRHDFKPAELICAKMVPPDEVVEEPPDGFEVNPCWVVTPRDYFESEGWQYDQEIRCPELEAAGFYEICEGAFEYAGEGDPDAAMASTGIERSPELEALMKRQWS